MANDIIAYNKKMNVGAKANTRDMCPKCYKTETEEVGSNNQYICNNPDCIAEDMHVQFFVKDDTSKQFPYDQIFQSRKLNEFYTKSYLQSD